MLGVHDDRVAFPLAEVDSEALYHVRAMLGGVGPFALINPGAAWPNKRWPADRYGEVAAFLRDVRQLPSVVLWGPGRRTLARGVADASTGAACVAPPTSLADLARAVARGVADDFRRYRSLARRRGGGHAVRFHLRPDRSHAERPMGARRRERVAVRVVRLPLRTALSSAGRLVPRRSSGVGGDRGRAAAPRECPCDGLGRMTSGLLRGIARRRVTLGFVSSAIALWLARPGPRSLAAGAAVAIVGEAVRVWAAGHLEKGREVTASGPYAFMRHPLYLGSTLIGIGLAVASASAIVAALVIAYLGITLTAAVRTEEAHLTEKFGDAYPAYRDGRAAGGEAAVQPCAGDPESRISRGPRVAAGAVGARVEGAHVTRARRPVLPVGRVRDYNRVLAGRLAALPDT